MGVQFAWGGIYAWGLFLGLADGQSHPLATMGAWCGVFVWVHEGTCPHLWPHPWPQVIFVMEDVDAASDIVQRRAPTGNCLETADNCLGTALAPALSVALSEGGGPATPVHGEIEGGDPSSSSIPPSPTPLSPPSTPSSAPASHPLTSHLSVANPPTATPMLAAPCSPMQTIARLAPQPSVGPSALVLQMNLVAQMAAR